MYLLDVARRNIERRLIAYRIGCADVDPFSD